MTPKDHMSQDLSYFSGPRTSGAVENERDTRKSGQRGVVSKPRVKRASKCRVLTNIVRRVARSGKGVVRGGFLGKAKVCEFEQSAGPLGGV